MLKAPRLVVSGGKSRGAGEDLAGTFGAAGVDSGQIPDFSGVAAYEDKERL